MNVVALQVHQSLGLVCYMIPLSFHLCSQVLKASPHWDKRVAVGFNGMTTILLSSAELHFSKSGSDPCCLRFGATF